jgi:hypothetical protein
MISNSIHRTIMLLGFSTAFLCLVSFLNLHASTLDNGMKDWDPSSLQGSIMEVRGDYLVISEQWVLLLNTSIKGKPLKTRVVDTRGRDMARKELKKGVLVLAKGGLAWDEKLKANVLLASEVLFLDKPLNMKDENERRRLLGPAKPW